MSAQVPEFVISRTFAAPRQALWDAWTRPEQFARWLGPKGVITTVLTHELKPGGVLHSRMDGPGGSPMWGCFTYREVSEPSRLVWVHAFSDEQGRLARSPFAQDWPLELLTTVTFEEAGAGTRVTLTWTPINATEAEQARFASMMASMTGGWTGSFDQLEEWLAGG